MGIGMVNFVKNRVDQIISDVDLKDKRILEIGVVGDGADDSFGGENWLHGKLLEKSKNVIGIDINGPGVTSLRKRGFNVLKVNAEEKFDLHKKFDIIIAARVIEHLQNLGIFFDNIKRHLSTRGVVVIITPNAHSISFFSQMLFCKRTDISKKHTHWHNEQSLCNLLESNGFKIIKVKYSHPRPIFNKLIGYLTQLLWALFPSRFGRQIFCVAEIKK